MLTHLPSSLTLAVCSFRLSSKRAHYTIPCAQTFDPYFQISKIKRMIKRALVAKIFWGKCPTPLTPRSRHLFSFYANSLRTFGNLYFLRRKILRRIREEFQGKAHVSVSHIKTRHGNDYILYFPHENRKSK